MNVLNIVIVFFAMLGAIDRILNNRFGIGKEFERGFELFGGLALSMIGMIVMVPFLANLMQPALTAIYNAFGIDPSLLPTLLIANDQGGAKLAMEVTQNADIGMFNGLVVSCMMGGTICFTIPFSLTSVSKEKHRELLLGMLCGITTIPVGCLAGGIVAGLPFGALIINLLPLIVFSAIIAVGLALCPNVCARIFNGLGVIIKILITVGLALSILRYFTGIELIKGLTPLEEAAEAPLICTFYLTGVLPFLSILSRLIAKPMRKLGDRLRVNEQSVLGFISTLANSITTFAEMDKMDPKGLLLNAAFSISAAFVFSDHLAFTMSFNPDYVGIVIFAKLVSAFTSLIVGVMLYNKMYKGKEEA